MDKESRLLDQGDCLRKMVSDSRRMGEPNAIEAMCKQPQTWFLFGVQGVPDGWKLAMTLMNYEAKAAQKLFREQKVTPVFKHTGKDQSIVLKEMGEG